MGMIGRRVRRLVRRKIRKPAQDAVKRAAQRWCPECQKRVQPFHVCAPQSDFRRRKAAAVRREKTERRRQRRREVTARRKARAKERRNAARNAPRQLRERRSHPYQTCTDGGCQRPLCVAFREGMAACPLMHK